MSLPSTTWLRAQLLFAGILLLIAPAIVQSSPSLPPAQIIEEGLRREAQRLQEQPRERVRDVLRPPSAKAAASHIPLETPCFDVRHIEWLGSGVAQFDWLPGVARPWLGHCLGTQGIEQLAGALNTALLNSGFITSRVTVPSQNVADGSLRIKVHVGRIATVESDPDVLWAGAFPIGPGDVLNVRDLDQGVEQMNRLSWRVIQAHLEPGSDPDSSVVRIQSQPGGARLRGELTLDNSGSPSLGRPQSSASLAFDEPLGLNDVISASIHSNLKDLAADHRSQSLTMSYSIPWGYNLFSFSANTTRFAQRIQLTTAEVVSSGRSQGMELRWERTIWRSQSSKWGGFAGVSSRRSSSFIDDVELGVQSRRNSFAMLGIRYRRLFSRASLDVELSLRKGVGWLGAEPDYDPQVSEGLTLRPRIWSGSVTLDIPDLFNRHARAPAGQGVHPVRLRSSLRWQHTKDITLTLDQFSIGSRGTVRGFDGSATLLAESGLAWRNELTMPLQLGGLPVIAYLAVDLGRVCGASGEQLAGKHLAGTALGLRSQWRQMYFDIALAMPLAKPSGFRSARFSPYMTLSYVF